MLPSNRSWFRKASTAITVNLSISRVEKILATSKRSGILHHECKAWIDADQ